MVRTKRAASAPRSRIRSPLICSSACFNGRLLSEWRRPTPYKGIDRVANQSNLFPATFSPFLSDGRVRFHSCMCSCCSTVNGKRLFTFNCEPIPINVFNDSYQLGINTISQAKGKLRRPWISLVLTLCFRITIAVHSFKSMWNANTTLYQSPFAIISRVSSIDHCSTRPAVADPVAVGVKQN